MRRRPLAFATGFFLAGILISVFNIDVLGILFTAFVLTTVVFIYKRSYMPMVALFLVFALLGVLRTQLAQEKQNSVQREFAGTRKLLTMTVTEFSDNGKVMVEFNHKGKDIKVYLDAENPVSLSPGDIIQARVSLQKPFSEKLKISGFSSYLLSCRTYLCGYTDSVEIIGRDKSGLNGAVYSFRRYADSIGKDLFEGDTRALFNAMVTGDKHLLSDELSEKLQKAGLNHIAVVSGMHLSLLVAVLNVLLENLVGKRKRGYAVIVAGILTMTLITGAGASVVRACIMCVVSIFARVFRRENDPITSLMLSVLIMTVFNPFIIFNAGFILSVSSVYGILLFNKKIYRALSKRLFAPIAQAAAVTISAQMTVTVPVIYYFGIVTPYSILSNILVTLIADSLVICGMLLIIFYKISPIAVIIKTLVRFLAEGIVVICNVIGKLPGALVEVSLSPMVVIVCVCMAVLVHKGLKNRQLVLRIMAVFTALFFVAACFAAYNKNCAKMQFVNYGAEDMSVVFYPDGDNVLIDCPSSYDAQEILQQRKADVYEYAVLTNRNMDKLQRLAENGCVKTVIVPREIFRSDKDKSSLKFLEKQGVNVLFLDKDDAFTGKNLQIRFLLFNETGDDAAAVEIRYKGKSFVSLQAFTHNEIEALKTAGVYIDCHYLKPPGADFHTEKELVNITGGKVLEKEKEFTAKIY